MPADATQQIQTLEATLDTISQTHLADLIGDALVGLRKRLDGNGLASDPLTTPKEAPARHPRFGDAESDLPGLGRHEHDAQPR